MLANNLEKILEESRSQEENTFKHLFSNTTSETN